MMLKRVLLLGMRCMWPLDLRFSLSLGTLDKVKPEAFSPVGWFSFLSLLF
ncbi:hypothetical protein ERO13_A10G181550v2 [Gossypium hirsutum]|nr:hypothetical protein ERO13_A10G181550v2 [Gossypium hirsutum]